MENKITWLGELKKCWVLIALVIGIIAISLILSYEPEFQRQCVSFSKGVWSNECIVNTIYNKN